MNKTKQIKIAFIAVVALGVVLNCTVASAVLLAPGGSVALPGTNLPGLVVQDIDRNVTVGPATFILRDRVTKNGDGTYNFNHFFQLTANTLATNGYFVKIVSFAESSFAGFSTSVDWDPTTLNGTISPAFADRSASGDIVIFRDYTPATMNINDQTYYSTTQTDALAYDLVGTCSINIQMMLPTGAPGDVFSGSVDTYAPTPEPATIAILGLGAVALLRKRRS
jgi:hypothetical protein